MRDEIAHDLREKMRDFNERKNRNKSTYSVKDI